MESVNNFFNPDMTHNLERKEAVFAALKGMHTSQAIEVMEDCIKIIRSIDCFHGVTATQVANRQPSVIGDTYRSIDDQKK